MTYYVSSYMHHFFKIRCNNKVSFSAMHLEIIKYYKYQCTGDDLTQDQSTTTHTPLAFLGCR